MIAPERERRVFNLLGLREMSNGRMEKILEGKNIKTVTVHSLRCFELSSLDDV
jgi:hypothetical protein